MDSVVYVGLEWFRVKRLMLVLELCKFMVIFGLCCLAGHCLLSASALCQVLLSFLSEELIFSLSV